MLDLEHLDCFASHQLVPLASSHGGGDGGAGAGGGFGDGDNGDGGGGDGGDGADGGERHGSWQTYCRELPQPSSFHPPSL